MPILLLLLFMDPFFYFMFPLYSLKLRFIWVFARAHMHIHQLENHFLLKNDLRYLHLLILLMCLVSTVLWYNYFMYYEIFNIFLWLILQIYFYIFFSYLRIFVFWFEQSPFTTIFNYAFSPISLLLLLIFVLSNLNHSFWHTHIIYTV